jgi:hypothetical protein
MTMELTMVKNASHPAFLKAFLSLLLLKLLLFCFVNSIQLRVVQYTRSLQTELLFLNSKQEKLNMLFPFLFAL